MGNHARFMYLHWGSKCHSNAIRKLFLPYNSKYINTTCHLQCSHCCRCKYVAMWHYFSCASQRLRLQRQTAWCVLMYSPSTATMTFSCHSINAMSMKHTLMLWNGAYKYRLPYPVIVHLWRHLQACHKETQHTVTSKHLRELITKGLNVLKTEHKLFYLKTQFVPRSKHFSSWLQKSVSWCYIGQQSLSVI
jgi:hypothetical protein